MFSVTQTGRAAFRLIVEDDGRVFTSLRNDGPMTEFPSLNQFYLWKIEKSCDSPSWKAICEALDLFVRMTSLTGTAPWDGDTAHRRGCQISDNPFPKGDRRHKEWDDDWCFRHNHAANAPDGIGGDMRPNDPA